MAGLMSGLTLGLMSLDMVDLEVRQAAVQGGSTAGGEVLQRGRWRRLAFDRAQL